MSAEGRRRAWAWVEHLRQGGTTAWTDFHDAVDDERGPWLPGAIQLEVVRRLNQLAGSRPAGHLLLVDRILDSSAPGRGQPDLGLVDAAAEPRFGPRPVDPSALPTSELVRMAVGALAEIVVDRDPGPQPAPRLRRRPPWRRDFQLVGDPVAVEATRAALGLAGTRPGPRARTAVVLGDDLGVVLADVWTWRVRQGASVPWAVWLGGWAHRDELPPQADLAAVAARWAGRVGSENVHVVVQHDPAAVVAGIVGRRRAPVPAYRGISGAAARVVRDANVVLRVLVEPERHRRLVEHVLLPLLEEERGPGWPVPARHLAWARRRAGRLRDDLVAGGYSLHGDPDLLVPDPTPADAAPSEDEVLAVALRALLATREEDQ